ncbi:MAG: hypothetical protein E7679_02885 [Ruminococcaceae bacterium]|nr:hypothetical protein [Oscillospiraceae bacterium]
MGQTVYVDLLFMINFSMDFLCFFICAKILGRKLSVGRAVAASAVGGIYSDLALFISVAYLPSLAIDLAVCVIICTIAFWRKGRVRELPLYILVYFAISMALGGFMTAIFNLLNKADLPLEGTTSDGISVWMFALLAALSALLTLLGGRFFRRKASQKSAELSVTYNGKSVKLLAMTDSGNLLREPIGGKPCIVADISALEGIIPRALTLAAREKRFSAIERLSPEDARRVRMIPIKTAGGEGALIALKADKITIERGDGSEVLDALIALSDIKNSADGKEALLPPELL